MTRQLSAMIFALLLAALPGNAAEEGYLEVTAPTRGLTMLSIPDPQPLEGAANPGVASEAAEVLRFDLGMPGVFTVDRESREHGKGIREGEFDFAPWSAAGASLLVKAGYAVSGDRLVTEFRLFDVPRQKQLAAKRYSGTVKELRRMAHAFCDEVLREVTGEQGPFTCKIAFVSTRSGSKEIHLMDFDGKNVQQVTANGSINLHPDFHPNGREIVYTSYKKKNPDLYRREIYSGAEARVSHHRGINITPAVSPDGSKIALSMSKDGNPEIYLIDSKGKELARLTNNAAIDISPAWSPDGSHIAFVSDRLGKPQVFVMRSDGTGLRRLTSSGSYNVGPDWSPKGDKIVYATQEGGFQIHVVNADGSGTRQLTSEGSNEHPRWSPDGRFVSFTSRRGGKEAIWIMRADGTGETRISYGKGNDMHPAWSPRR